MFFENIHLKLNQFSKIESEKVGTDSIEFVSTTWHKVLQQYVGLHYNK
jgi:hypothetical protein